VLKPGTSHGRQLVFCNTQQDNCCTGTTHGHLAQTQQNHAHPVNQLLQGQIQQQLQA